MAKGTTFANELLLHIFNNAALPLIGDTIGLRTSSADGSLYVSLHTALPGNEQTGNEVTSTGYARVAVARTSAGWVVTSGTVKPVAAIAFPVCSAGTDIAAYWAVGTASSGTGKVLYKGTMDSPVTCGGGAAPRLSTDTVITES